MNETPVQFMKTALSLVLGTFAAVIALTGCQKGMSEKPVAGIDERLELMNVVFRVADVPWYRTGKIESFNDAVDSYFAPYKQHEAVNYAAEISERYRIGGDAVPSYAMSLEIEDGKISFIDGIKLDLDPRWQDDTPYKFLEQLNAFYADTYFHDFFERQQPIYDLAVQRYNEGFKNVDFGWFDRYFGGKNGGNKFNIVLNLGESEWNFGATTTTDDGNENIYAVIATSYTDSLGRPTYGRWSYEVVIHELIHSYTNPLIDLHSACLQAANRRFYEFSEDKLRNAGVGSAKLFMYETLVRAAYIEYHREHSDGAFVDKIINWERDSGFLWIGKLCGLLSEEYEMNRDKYPDLRSFMPEIVKLLGSLSPEEENTAQTTDYGVLTQIHTP